MVKIVKSYMVFLNQPKKKELIALEMLLHYILVTLACCNLHSFLSIRTNSGYCSSSMADEVDHHSVHVIDHCQVSPPPGSLPSTTVPLSYLDLPWFYCTPMKRIFFYEFPYPKHHFLQTVLPILKHSLSLTLQHFFPFAANVVFPPKPQAPHILYSQGGSVSFTVAESTTHFNQLISDSPRDVRDAYPFVPSLPSPSTLEDGTLLIPTMAIQVTVFPNSGFTICTTFRHEIADGRAFHHFMKFWASLCRSKEGNFGANLPLLPLHNRGMIEDSKSLKPDFLERLWNSPPKTIESTSASRDSTFLRHRFTLSHHQVEKLKKWVSIKSQSIMGLNTPHLSTFAVTCSLFWVCKVKSEDTTKDTVEDDYYCGLGFLVDLRNHTTPELSIPPTYFGNCLTGCLVTLQKRKLVGENGTCEAMNAIGSQIRGLKGDPLKGVEGFMSGGGGSDKEECGKLPKFVNVMHVAGSPKLNVYETDFGWGKPKLSEALHADGSGAMCLSDSGDEDCSIEVGLALKGVQMKKFCAILEEQLRDICTS